MPVRPTASQELHDNRRWIWPHGDGTRLPRYAVGTEISARRGSLGFIRELRLWDQETGRDRNNPDDPAHLCDEEDSEDDQTALRSDAMDVETDTAVPRPLQQSTIFREGAVFKGTQRVSRASGRSSPEDWGVIVTIHEIDLGRGRCSGDMMAENVPLAASPVVTHWEGEIVDGLNNSFVTCKWGASYSIDLAHWRRFSAFAPLNRKVMHAHGRYNKLHEFPYIFMRWKESFFVNVREEGCSLTIAGFYYVCLSRESGRVEGYYFDPNCTPYQKLEMELERPLPCFSTYEFA